jgi:hypothetical protein
LEHTGYWNNQTDGNQDSNCNKKNPAQLIFMDGLANKQTYHLKDIIAPPDRLASIFTWKDGPGNFCKIFLKKPPGQHPGGTNKPEFQPLNELCDHSFKANS